MSLVISQAIVLTSAIVDDGNLPLIGWHNLVAPGNIAADTEDPDFPATNLSNPQTFSAWKAADTTEQYLTFVTGYADSLDYLAIAGHNLAAAAVSVSIEGKLAEGEWTEIVQEVQLPDNGPALFRFAPQPLTQIRIRLRSGSAAASIAVVYFGKLLVLERKVWQGLTPPPLGRKSKVTSGKSESGQFLGRIVLGEWVETKIPLSLLDPGWVRANMVPFLNAARNEPFFLAWRPQDYPREVGFMWLRTDPVPVNESPSGLTAMALDLQGIV